MVVAALRVIELLLERGARVDYNDPCFPRVHKMCPCDFRLASMELTAEGLANYVAVVIVTDHSSHNYDFIIRHARWVTDTRVPVAICVGTTKRSSTASRPSELGAMRSGSDGEALRS